MTNAIATAVLTTGIVDRKMLDELKRWGAPIDIPEKLPEFPTSLEEAARIIEEALQSEGYVVTRETDLEVLQQYLATQKTGKLHVEVEPVADVILGTQATFDVTYGRTPLGAYILGWQGESIRDEMTNGLTHLIEDDGNVYFHDVREVFYGEQKAFMICIASTKEPGGV